MSEFLKNVKRYAHLHRILLAIVGCLPSKTGKYILPHSMSLFVVEVYLIYIVIENIYVAWPDDINQIAYHTAPVLAFILLCIRHINFIIIHEKFWLENVTSSARERAVIETYARRIYLFNICQIIPMFSASPMWILFPFVNMFYFQRNNGEPFRLVLPFQHHYISDVYDDFRYYVLYLIQSLAVCFVAVVLSSLDCLYIHFVISTCGQFKILQMRVRHFDKDDNGVKLTSNEQMKKVHSCIELHQHLLKFCEILETTVNFNLFVTFFVTVGFSCIVGYIMTLFESDMFIYVQNVLCLATSLSAFFLQCYAANLLTTEGEEVAFAAYSSNWMDATRKVKKHILIIIMRAQKPIYLTIGTFAPVSLSTFETMVRSAASYFTVLTSMKEKD